MTGSSIRRHGVFFFLLVLVAAGLGLLLVACDTGLTPAQPGPSAARSGTVTGTTPSSAPTEEVDRSGVPASPGPDVVQGVGGQPDDNALLGPGAHDGGDTASVPPDTAGVPDRTSQPPRDGQ